MSETECAPECYFSVKELLVLPRLALTAPFRLRRDGLAVGHHHRLAHDLFARD